MKSITFATLAIPSSADKTVLLIESLRRFGSGYADSPVLVLSPSHANVLPAITNDRLDALDAQRVVFELAPELRSFPLAVVPAAADAAERTAAQKGGLLVWMLPDSLVLNPPAAFDLSEGVDFAYRPVHHTLVGSLYERPPDAFWTAVYQHCGTPPERLFRMQTCLRDHIIRPYFNAGLMLVRPELGLLQAWNEQFIHMAGHPDFTPFYEQDPRYALFMHQAVLSAVAPARLTQERMLELPESVNYPVHLHAEYPQAYRPKKISDLVTCRYEDFEVLQQALDADLFAGSQQGWLKTRLESLSS